MLTFLSFGCSGSDSSAGAPSGGSPDVSAGNGQGAGTGGQRADMDAPRVQDERPSPEPGVGGGGGGGGADGASDSSSPCWSGSVATWTATDYASRKWARWPIPHLPGSGLPHPTSYSETEEGIVDEVTGLVWQKTTSPSGSTWAEALDYCASLGPGWTLPTRIELTTIIFHEKSGAKTDAAFDYGASAGWTWTSTPWVVNERRNLTRASALSWFVNFAVGDTHNSLSQTNDAGRSRCVRIQPTLVLPAEHYTISEHEVTDNYTCLTWERAGSGTTPSLTRQQAIEYCEGLTLGGYQWRVPTLNELASLVDDVPSGDVSPAIDKSAFPETSPNAKYWSMSGYGSEPTTFWTLNFEDGYTQHNGNDATSSLANVRCVRDE